MTIDQLEEHLGGADSVGVDGNGDSGDRLVRLHHAHLPMLRDADVIVYDADRGTVEPGEQFQAVLSLLRVIDEHREETSMIADGP